VSDAGRPRRPASSYVGRAPAASVPTEPSMKGGPSVKGCLVVARFGRERGPQRSLGSRHPHGATLDAQESRPSCGDALSQPELAAPVCRGARGSRLGDRGPLGGKRRSEPRKVLLEPEPGTFLEDRIGPRAARAGCGKIASPSQPLEEAGFQHGPFCPGRAHGRVGCTADLSVRTSSSRTTQLRFPHIGQRVGARSTTAP